MRASLAEAVVEPALMCEHVSVLSGCFILHASLFIPNLSMLSIGILELIFILCFASLSSVSCLALSSSLLITLLQIKQRKGSGPTGGMLAPSWSVHQPSRYQLCLYGPPLYEGTDSFLLICSG